MHGFWNHSVRQTGVRTKATGGAHPAASAWWMDASCMAPAGVRKLSHCQAARVSCTVWWVVHAMVYSFVLAWSLQWAVKYSMVENKTSTFCCCFADTFIFLLLTNLYKRCVYSKPRQREDPNQQWNRTDVLASNFIFWMTRNISNRFVLCGVVRYQLQNIPKNVVDLKWSYFMFVWPVMCLREWWEHHSNLCHGHFVSHGSS